MQMTVKIESVGHRAVGIARYHGKVCFVPYTVPGDTVLVEVVRQHSSYNQCRLITVIDASSLRRPPICRYYGRCGGCNLQHMTYDVQLKVKEIILRTTMKRLKQKNAVLSPIIPSPLEYNYRRSTRLHWGQTGYGYYEAQSRVVIEIDTCPLLCLTLNEYMESLKTRLTPKNLRPPSIRITCNNRGDCVDDHFQGNDIEYRLDFPFEFSIFGDASTFFQSNMGNLRPWLETIHRLADIKPNERVLDLYCGSGTIGISFSKKAAHVSGLDINEKSIQYARMSATANELANTAWYAGSYVKLLPELGKWDVVILDPPRLGVRSEVLKVLCRTKPKRIIYVSCDHMTWARDAEILIQSGYSLGHTVPIDFFPQTFHFELVSQFSL